MKFNRKELIEKLVAANVTVTFTKKDGTDRVMNCTLQESVIPPAVVKADDAEVRKVNDAVLAVWDIDKSAWRSFRIDSIKSVEV
jgi:hypothetical protein